jgi:serine/threonine protein kinase
MSPASDMWSLGITLLNTFLYSKPFEISGGKMKDAKADLALKWESWFGRLPWNLRFFLRRIDFELTPDNGPCLRPKLHDELFDNTLKRPDVLDVADGIWYQSLVEFADFLERALDYHAIRRLTARQALNHPFVRNANLGNGPYNFTAETKRNWFQRMKRFVGPLIGGKKPKSAPNQDTDDSPVGGAAAKTQNEILATGNLGFPTDKMRLDHKKNIDVPINQSSQNAQINDPAPRANPLFNKGWFQRRKKQHPAAEPAAEPENDSKASWHSGAKKHRPLTRRLLR